MRRVRRGIYAMYPESDSDFAVAQARETGIVVEFEYQKDWFLSEDEVMTALRLMREELPQWSARKWTVRMV